MKEQSHKAEMASALRGDFARLRARGVATTLPAAAEPRPAGVVTPAVVAEPDLGLPPAAPAAAPPEPVAAPVRPAVEEERPPAPPSWLDRVLGR